MSLSRRIDKLEHQQIRQQPPPLFIRRAGQVAGWRSGDKVVTRRDNESETDLQDRVTADYGGAILWTSIKPEKEMNNATQNLTPTQTEPSASS
ncbi:MAG: hypothetical protein SWC96_03935 [Thermodesulfobacteriota bacterium]|nr:hypothetical protein [Thermodesulfobacteriota bacterium]